MNKISGDSVFIQMSDVESAVILAGSETQHDACGQSPFCMDLLQSVMQQELPLSDTQDYQLLESDDLSALVPAYGQAQQDLADETAALASVVAGTPDYIAASAMVSLSAASVVTEHSAGSAAPVGRKELSPPAPQLPPISPSQSPLNSAPVLPPISSPDPRSGVSEAGGKDSSQTNAVAAPGNYKSISALADTAVGLSGMRQQLPGVNDIYQLLAQAKQDMPINTSMIPQTPTDNRNHMPATDFEQGILASVMDSSRHRGAGETPALLSAVPAITAATSTQSTTAGYEWRSPALDAREVGLGKKLTSILGDKIHLQMGHSIQRANIRLDPPNLGLIEIQIITEGDKTKVQLFSANAFVRDVMLQNIDQLRTQLAQKLGMDTSVEVGSESPGERDQKQAMEQAHTIIAGEHEEGELLVQLKQQSGWINRLI